MDRFPTPAHLAAAPLDELLALWAGLGYYARARNLHKAARQVCARHAGAVPNDPGAFGDLAGVGRYTLGAVQSIAFDRPLPAVDGNAVRVLTRLDRIEDDIRRPATMRTVWARAEALVAGPRPGDLNQAIMELGARVCASRSPRCLLCPVADRCEGRRAGVHERLPLKTRKVRRRAVELAAGLVRDGDGLWLGQRPEDGLLGGLWELPALEVPVPDPSAIAALSLEAIGAARIVRHTFTHLDWSLHVYPARGRPCGGAYDRFALVPCAALGDIGLAGPALKALHAFEVDGAPVRRGAGRQTEARSDAAMASRRSHEAR